MAKATPETEIAVLQEQTKTLHGDLNEMKSDIKEIKEMLSNKFVTKEEFEAYKKTQQLVRVVVGVVTAVITAIITFEVTKLFR